MIMGLGSCGTGGHDGSGNRESLDIVEIKQERMSLFSSIGQSFEFLDNYGLNLEFKEVYSISEIQSQLNLQVNTDLKLKIGRHTSLLIVNNH